MAAPDANGISFSGFLVFILVLILPIISGRDGVILNQMMTMILVLVVVSLLMRMMIAERDLRGIAGALLALDWYVPRPLVVFFVFFVLQF